MAGKLIVIDGIDSSGKATQTRLLVERLVREGRAVEHIEFPRYGNPLFGELLAECLAGKHGDFAHLDPKIAAVLYTLDRFESLGQIRAWLAEGKIVIADRFTSSNQIHQGGKIIDAQKRADFLDWLDTMEHDVLGIPHPDVVVYLRVPIETSIALLSGDREKKNAALEGSVDVVEKDRMYIERSFESAERLHESLGWLPIECTQAGVMRAPESIAEDVYRAIEKLV